MFIYFCFLFAFIYLFIIYFVSKYMCFALYVEFVILKIAIGKAVPLQVWIGGSHSFQTIGT